MSGRKLVGLGFGSTMEHVMMTITLKDAGMMERIAVKVIALTVVFAPLANVTRLEQISAVH